MKTYKLLVCLCWVLMGISCQNFLDVAPINIVTDDAIFQSESGVKAYLTTLYADLPIEDFRYGQRGFNPDGKGGARLAHLTGEAMSSTGDDISTIGDGTWWGLWDFGKVRRVNYLLQTLPKYQSNFANQDLYRAFLGEAYFIRAYYYFAMVKRYGGVPIIEEPLTYDSDNLETLRLPRDQEKACYDFIADDLDNAAELLPNNENLLGKGRATRLAALALKSRAMLYAGTIARYGDHDAAHCVGIESSYADDYFRLAFEAVDEVVSSGKFSLYRANSHPEKNYSELFLADDSPENIFVKYYQRTVNAHGWDVYFIPYQYRGSGYASGMNPTLEFAELFERLDGSPAAFAERIRNERFDDPAELFQGLDARFAGSVIYPNALFKGEACSIQKGLIIENGTKRENATQYETALYKAQSGKEYHIVGKSGSGKFSGNMTGLYVRKYLDESLPQSEVKEAYSTQHWIDIRLAEVLLNGIEAAVESNTHRDKALEWINDLRTRAGLKALTSAELTIDKVRRERRIELAFENHTYWDLRRWRVADKELESKQFTALNPYLDIRDEKYLFEAAPANSYYYTFERKMYYERIPDGEIAKNHRLVQNPYYN
ncbi:RagB/SusD family nutrient uptake outer membrane protein [Parabacteroides sp. OttesenSCG-928-N08]|nr:RagB/SusD family nutrient uptake outer membrane protein [Parabacteroides sp. OttesenSCG-928-N08]